MYISTLPPGTLLEDERPRGAKGNHPPEAILDPPAPR